MHCHLAGRKACQLHVLISTTSMVSTTFKSGFPGTGRQAGVSVQLSSPHAYHLNVGSQGEAAGHAAGVL